MICALEHIYNMEITMFIRPVFEIIGITLVSFSILLMVFVHKPIALIFGVALLVSGLGVIYRHYVEMGTDPDVLDYVPGTEVLE